MFDIAALSASFGGFIWVVFFFVLALSIIVAVHEYGPVSYTHLRAHET